MNFLKAPHLNKRAAKTPELLPLWHIGDAHSIFAGPLNYNAPHSHSVPVLIAGLHDKFAIRFAHGPWQRVEAALIRAGTAYELDVGGKPVCVIYLEPCTAGFDALRPLIRGGEALNDAIVGNCSERSLLRQFYDDPGSMNWASLALDEIVQRQPTSNKAETLDHRIARIMRRLQSEPDPSPAADQAARAELSSSRFQHLFTENVGVPFRRYRAWCRLRNAVREVVSGASLTVAAHHAGFADQSHFSRMFRTTFGAPPSHTLSDVRT